MDLIGLKSEVLAFSAVKTDLFYFYYYVLEFISHSKLKTY